MPVRAYKKRMPVVSVRGLAVIPGMIIHFDIVKDTAVRAIERAMVQKDQQVFIVLARQEDEEEELYGIGCIASVKQVLKLPDKTIRCSWREYAAVSFLTFMRKRAAAWAS